MRFERTAAGRCRAGAATCKSWVGSDSRGITLLEGLVALAFVGIVAASVLTAYMAQVSSNTRNEIRSAAVLALHERMEALRLEDPESLPLAGSSAPQLVTVGTLEFEVVTGYCGIPVYCNDTTRHVTVEVYHDGHRIYDAQTVFTQLL